MELNLALAVSSLECGDELTAEQAAEHLDWKKEGSTGENPTVVTRSESAGGDHAVDMRMVLQALIPGVKHTEKADVGTEMARIAGDLQQSFGAGVKQQVIDESLVLQRQRSQFAWQREDDMDVGCRQQFSLARMKPAQARVALTSGAMPVSTRVIRDGSMSAR